MTTIAMMLTEAISLRGTGSEEVNENGHRRLVRKISDKSSGRASRASESRVVRRGDQKELGAAECKQEKTSWIATTAAFAAAASTTANSSPSRQPSR